MNPLNPYLNFRGFIAYWLILLTGSGPSFAQVKNDSQAGASSSKKALTRNESEKNAERRDLTLTAGEDKVVDLDVDIGSLPETTFASVANDQIVKIVRVNTADKVSDFRQVVFRGLKAGETTVVVRDQKGEVKIIFRVLVAPSNLDVRMAELRELLRDIEGLEIKIVGQKIVFDGELLVLSDYARLVNVISDKNYADLVINLAIISNLSLEYVKNRIAADPNFPQKVSIRTLNGMLILDGTVESEAEKTLAIDVAKLYVPEVNLSNPLVDKGGARELAQPRGIIQALIKVVPPKQDPAQQQKEKLIRVTVHFVELTKDYNKIFGFTWRPGFTSAPQISIGQDSAEQQAAQAASFSATLSNLFPKLQSAQNAGYARVIKSGTLIVKSGQPADMSENTRFPITIFSPQNGQVSASGEDVGLAFSVTPSIVGQTEDINMDLDLNQKSLVGRAPAAGQAPITASHRVKTKIFVRNGESAAVVGVNSGEVVTQFNKDDPSPGSFAEGTEPLFNLNRSKQYAKKKSQFVIFVTPQLIENAHEGTEDLKKSFRVKVN